MLSRWAELTPADAQLLTQQGGALLLGPLTQPLTQPPNQPLTQPLRDSSLNSEPDGAVAAPRRLRPTVWAHRDSGILKTAPVDALLAAAGA